MCGTNTDEVHLSAGAGCGAWRLGREIGRGAYGVVHFATGPDGAVAAVKVCRRRDIGDERYGRELRGAKLYRAIPRTLGLICMKELVEEPWGFYCAMELADDEFGRDVSGSADYRPKTLASVIEGDKALPLGECVKLGIALANGIETLQRHHLLHRDIKPGNVLYVGGCPVLADPGLVVDERDAASLVGTPGYVPPENFTDSTGDIFSLGLTLKTASFGRRVEDMDKGPAQEADTGAVHFPAWWRILNKATDPTPSRRYQSAKALLKDLERLRLKIELASVVGSRVAKMTIVIAALGIMAIVAWSIIANRQATDKIAEQSSKSSLGMSMLVERALRDSLGSVLSDERIKEEAKKTLSGEEATLTPEERDAFMRKIYEDFGLNKIRQDVNELENRSTNDKKDLEN